MRSKTFDKNLIKLILNKEDNLIKSINLVEYLPKINSNTKFYSNNLVDDNFIVDTKSTITISNDSFEFYSTTVSILTDIIQGRVLVENKINEVIINNDLEENPANYFKIDNVANLMHIYENNTIANTYDLKLDFSLKYNKYNISFINNTVDISYEIPGIIVFVYYDFASKIFGIGGYNIVSTKYLGTDCYTGAVVQK